MDFAPAHTVMQRARALRGRSCEMSRTALTPRCTPPMPPVTKTRMPAASAMCKDAATVVPPLNPMATATGMSRGPIFLTHLARASISSSDLERPTRILPETRAVVAGTAPPLRTMPSSSCASSRLIGYGMPWVMMADSSATTGVPLRRASWISSAITNSSGWDSLRLAPSANPLVTLLPVLRPVSWSFSLRCALLTMRGSSEVCCGQKGFHGSHVDTRAQSPWRRTKYTPCIGPTCSGISYRQDNEQGRPSRMSVLDNLRAPRACFLNTRGVLLGTAMLFHHMGAWYFCKPTVYCDSLRPVSYTHLRAHETRHDLVCRLLLEKKKKKKTKHRRV